MKKTISIVFLLLAMQTVIFGQCGIKKKQILKDCEGIYLKDQEIKSNSENGENVAMVLNQKVKYAFYLLNPNKDFPELTITNENDIPVEIKFEYNKEKNFKVMVFKPQATTKYFLKFDFGEQKDACVLFALYFQGNIGS